MAKRNRVNRVLEGTRDIGRDGSLTVPGIEALKTQPVAPPAPPLAESIAVAFDANIDAVVPHHNKGGHVDKEKLTQAMDALLNNRIMFVGMYHDNRKKEFYDHLADHYKTLGMKAPK